ncbi:hypothetical protein ACSBR2_037692 [Camellia fascicularis]
MLFQRAKALGLIKGAVIGHKETNVTYLQFVDDTVVFCKAEEQEILNVKRILRCFEVLFGLRINFYKSHVCGVGVQEEVLADFAEKLNCQSKKLPFMYLGLPLGASPKRRSIWLPVINKFKSKLASWKRKLLSYGDSCGGGSEVKKRLPMVKWEEVTVKKSLGGLGIKRLKYFNECLLAKWWWRYGIEDMALWKDIVISKYGSFGGRWRPFLANVGNGLRVSFWEDPWASDRCLKDEFPRIYDLPADKEVTMKQILDRRSLAAGWSFNFRRCLRAWEEDEVGRLRSYLSSLEPILSDKMDSLVWSASSTGVFTVNSAYCRNDVGQGLGFTKWIWNNISLPKVKFFGWLVWKGKIKTKAFLQRWLVLVRMLETECVFCGCGVETDCHVLLQCQFAWTVWSNILNLWGMQWVVPANAKGVMDWWRGIWGKLENKIWNAIPFAVVWSIWNMRNDCIFNGKHHLLEEVCELIKIKVALSIKANASELQYSVHDVVENLQQIR